MTDEIKKLIEEAKELADANWMHVSECTDEEHVNHIVLGRAKETLAELATTLSVVAGERDELAAELARAREDFVAILKVSKGTWIEDVHEMRRIAQSQINALATNAEPVMSKSVIKRLAALRGGQEGDDAR